MRHTFVRSMRGHAQVESVVPWRGYVLWVGGVLIALFVALDALMRPPAISRQFGAPAKMPTIRIHSEVKGPEKVTIDTAGFVPPQPPTEQVVALEQNAFSSRVIEWQATPHRPERTEVSGSALASRPVPGVRETFAQLAPQAELARFKRTSRRHPPHPGQARTRKTHPH